MTSSPDPFTPRPAPRHIGCVSYLNAKPLIEGLDPGSGAATHANLIVRYDVPSRLLEDLQSGAVDIALCPVIDYFRSQEPLEIVPVGGIGCRGPTLTVRLFSQVPLDQITTVYADTDSHTSVALMRVLLAQRLNLRPRVVAYDAREQIADNRVLPQPQTVLLIGDKVVTNSPDAAVYPHQIDLGESWLALTGLPFVFAVWMTRAGTDLGDLPATLQAQRIANAARIPAIAELYAQRHGWPPPLALEYLGHLLRYAIGPEELRAIAYFGSLAFQLGLVDEPRVLRVHPAVPPHGVQSA